MDQQQQQLIERIHQAQNILVTVSTNPSVDQLAAAIGLTLVLNKLDKHGTAVFSGEVPSTIEFLKPEETLEKNTDSLRDFIIALDKSKADKLRYKVEDQVVRIFITPYKTSISEKDLDFSQGDFNVDVVVALGVTEQQDLDSAITAHGRILHDATVVSVSTEGQGSLGSINWVDPAASSLSEMMVSLMDGLDKKAVDSQIATALLTGIVAVTDRFRNEKTTPKTMSLSAELMSAGANQQLIATELEAAVRVDHGTTEIVAEEPDDAPSEEAPEPEKPKPEPGTLEIDHEEAADQPPAEPEKPETPAVQPQIHVDADGQLSTLENQAGPGISQVRGVASDGTPTENNREEVKRERLVEPPKVDAGNLTANTQPEGFDPTTEELSLPSVQASPLLTHNESVLPPTVDIPAVPPAPEPAPAGWQPPSVPPVTPDETLTEIEQSVGSPHLDAPADQAAPANVDDARNAVEAALNSAEAPADPLRPIAALNAQPLGTDLHAAEPPAPVPNPGFSEPTPGSSPADAALDMPLPPNPFTAPQAPATPNIPPSAFPGAPANDQDAGSPPPPPLPPPFIPRPQ